MSLTRRVARLEEHRTGSRHPDGRLHEVLRRMTDEELEALVAAIDNAPGDDDAPIRFRDEDWRIAHRLESLWEETAR